MSSHRESTIEKGKAIVEGRISDLFDLWQETGIKKEILETYATQVLSHLTGLMQEMVEESQQKKRELVRNVKTLVQTARKISKELGIIFAAETYGDDFPLMDLEIKLTEEVKQLQHLKEQRLKYVQELLNKEVELCKKLGTKSTGFYSEIPTEEEIKQFENLVNLQELEKNRLSEAFKDTRRMIIKMMDDLQKSPELDFDRIVCHDPNNFIFSPINMTKLRDLKERLKDQVEQAKLEAEDKKATLISLWDYLDEPMENRKAFFDTYSGFSLNTINALKIEIQKCKEKRSENIANYVQKIRKEIEVLWEKCKYSELQTKSFTAMKCHTYTEDLLTLHELEAENLRKYYNNNRKIFELLDEWEIQFEKLKDLDKRANDPERYHNRGGQLLLEEKERKAAEKKLPKIENQLCNLVSEYENIQRKLFLINGSTVIDFMNHKREMYEIEKENMKAARKQAKDRSIKKTPLSTSKRTPCASMLRITPASNRLFRTPGGTNVSRVTPAAKRKLPYDVSPNTTENKKRAVSADKHKNTVLCNKVRRSGRLQGGTTLNGSSRGKNNSSRKKRKSRNDTLLSISYANFQEHLDNRDELRSSINPKNIQNEISMRPPTKTPLKTPIKPVRRKVLAASTPTAANSTRVLRGTSRIP